MNVGKHTLRVRSGCSGIGLQDWVHDALTLALKLSLSPFRGLVFPEVKVLPAGNLVMNQRYHVFLQQQAEGGECHRGGE